MYNPSADESAKLRTAHEKALNKFASEVCIYCFFFLKSTEPR